MGNVNCKMVQPDSLVRAGPGNLASTAAEATGGTDRARERTGQCRLQDKTSSTSVQNAIVKAPCIPFSPKSQQTAKHGQVMPPLMKQNKELGLGWASCPE